ncbi:MAG: hypothetical protein KatS3mg095_0379 [Candidatus Parcubacteria bacterium]|nr:MAG: hypothetical protein KatS3mg095_0379 [Candidatus Parcubacteria bacterium]
MSKNLIWGIIIGIVLVGGVYTLVKTPFKSSKLAGLEFIVYKTPTCGCCEEYVGYLRMNGANVKVNEVSDEELTKIKTQHNIPQTLWSCHTVLITQNYAELTQNLQNNADNNIRVNLRNNPRESAYFIEGHIPIEAISKLLTEKPDINGIVLPGMPSGSPGMPGIKFYPFKIHSVKDGKDQGLFIEI